MIVIDPANGSGQYAALDGSEVVVPALPALPDGPMPRFGDADVPALRKLIAFRERSIAGETGQSELGADPATLAPEIREMAERAVSQQRAWRLGLAGEMARRRKRSDARFGADGRGFLAALDTGEILADFWPALRILMFQRIGLMEYHAPEEHAIVRDWLARFPPRVWVPLVSQVCEPLLDHRKSDVLHTLMDAFLAAPYADFRHLESGPAKPQRLEDLPAGLLARMLEQTFATQSQFQRFKRLAVSAGTPDDPAVETARALEVAALLRSEGITALTPDQLTLVREFLFEQQPARRHADGAVQSEINFHRAAAFRAAMAGLARGKPEGHYMREALSTRPAGFRGINLTLYRREIVWPYVASHLDMIDRALGLADPLPVEPKFEPAKAVPLLRLLPKPPERYGDILFEIATGTGRGGRADAQALLAGARAYTPRAVERLASRAAGAREQAGRTLGAIGDPAAVGPLRRRLARERSIKVEGACLDALGRLGAWDETLAMSAEALAAEALTGLAKPWKATLAWVAELVPPPLRFADGAPVGAGVAAWLLRVAAETGAPTGSVSLDYRLGALDAASRSRLGGWVLETWIAYDTQPWTVRHLAEAWAEYPKLAGRSYVGVRYQTVPGTEFGQRQVEAEGWPTAEQWLRTHRAELERALKGITAWEHYPKSGHDARGLLAMARHADAELIAEAIGQYLSAHRRRTAQAKALLDFAASVGTDRCLALIRHLRDDESAPQGLRAHARGLGTPTKPSGSGR